MISSIVYEFTTVLSNNPFLLNPALSKGVLIFMGCLAGSMILILYYLLRYDYHENMQTKYTKGEGDAIARKKLEEDIKNGGKGDLGETYRQHIQHVKVLHRKLSHESQNIQYILALFRKKVFPKIPQDSNATAVDNSNKMKKDISKNELLSASKSDDDDDEDSTDESVDHDESFDQQEARMAIVTDFLNKLFPGRSIFSGRKNIVDIVFDHHEYFKMLGSSSVTKSRAVRFVGVISLVLTGIFVDTVFFGIYFPPTSPCTFQTTEVRDSILPIIKLCNNLLFG